MGKFTHYPCPTLLKPSESQNLNNPQPEMQTLLRSLVTNHRNHHFHRSISDIPSLKLVRDRGLDHAVEREKNLKPVINIKNLIKSEPSKSLPLSVISTNKESLSICTRPIELIRKYPSIFEEFVPGGTGFHPHIKLTRKVLELDSEETLVYSSENYKNDVANRLVKLLMITRVHKIPLKLLDFLKWDLGLPCDYLESLVPEFPDCFRVVKGGNLGCGFGSDSELELVCWSDELAVSVIEQGAKKKGVDAMIPERLPSGCVVESKVKKWCAEWQKLPYVSPYENALHLGPSSDESDKWVVGVLHEILNLFVGKKVERETLFGIGDWLGIRSRIKRALLHHPGIFYVSGKIRTNTVVLWDAYNRGMLIEKNPVVNVRNQYIHLMKTVIENRKDTTLPGKSKQKEKNPDQEPKGEAEQVDDEDSVEVNQVDSDFEDDSDNDSEESMTRNFARRNLRGNKELAGEKKKLNSRRPSRISQREPSENRVKKYERRDFRKGSQENIKSPIIDKLLTAKRTHKGKKLKEKRDGTV